MLLVVLGLGAAACGGGSDGGGGGGGESDDTVQRKVVTTDAGTVIVRAVTEKEGLEVEVQGDSVYVAFTKETPAATRAALQGKPLGGRCRLADGREIGTIQLLWREDPGNWGSNLGVQGVYEQGDALPGDIRTCDLRRGQAVGVGQTDINAGPVLTSVRFTEE